MASSSFPTSIAKKLDDSNYLHRREYVEPVIKSHKLQRFVANLVAPTRYLTKSYHFADMVSMMLRRFTIKLLLSGCTLLGCTHSYEVWEKIHEKFNLQTKLHFNNI